MKLLLPRPTLLVIFCVVLSCLSAKAAETGTRSSHFLKVSLSDLQVRNADSALLIQNQLQAIYGGDPQWHRDSLLDFGMLKDSRIGPRTASWLQRFCIDFRIKGQGEQWQVLRQGLQRVTSLRRSDPSLVNALISADFLRWSQQVALSEDLDAVIAHGELGELRKLVERYRNDWGEAKRWPRDTIHSHVMNLASIAGLKSREALQKMLSSFTFPLDPPYDGLKNAVRTALASDSSRFGAVWARLCRILEERWRNDSTVINGSGFRADEIDAVLDTLGGARIPAPLSKLLLEIEGVEYPDSLHLKLAAYDKFVVGMGICMGNDRSDNIYLHDIRLDSAGFAQVDSLLQEIALAGLSSEEEDEVKRDLAIIRNLRMESLVCDDQDLKLGKQALDSLFNRFMAPSLATLPPTVRIHHRTDSLMPATQRCGCVRAGLAGTVYGLYPPHESAKGALDYGVLSRIAYFGIGFDEKGVLQYLNDLGADPTSFAGTDAKRRDFVRQAHAHGTKVDWVLAKDDWGRDWARLSVQERRNILNQVASNLVKHLTTVLSDPMSKAMPWLSFRHTRAATRGDGVILYFRNYPDDQTLEGSAGLLREFVRDLQDRLAREGGGYQVSLMVLQSQLEAENEAFRPKSILDMFDTSRIVSQARVQVPTVWMDMQGAQKDSIKLVADSLLRALGSRGKVIGFTHIADSLTQVLAKAGAKDAHGSWFGQPTLGQCNVGGQLLVVIQEPTSEAKKRLRQFIEKSLRGNERVRLLRSTVPVLNFDHKNWGQLADDLIYFKDNFGGVAFWPWVDSAGNDTAQTCEGSRSLSRCLELNYSDGSIPERGSWNALFESKVCPNRWTIRLLIAAFLLMLAAFVVLSVFVDQVRRRVRPVFSWLLGLFVLPPILMFLSLVLYDPELAFLTAGKGPLIGAILLLVAGFLGTAIFLQRRRVLPSRPALRVFLEDHK